MSPTLREQPSKGAHMAGPDPFELMFVIDSARAIEDLDGDREAYEQICAIFLKQARRILDNLRSPEGVKAEQLRRSLHEVSTSAYIVGAQKASAYLRHCEALLEDSAEHSEIAAAGMLRDVELTMVSLSEQVERFLTR